jgi:hypothetical protein
MMPTGWRPADVSAKYPVYKIENVYSFEKYSPKTSSALETWSWIQLSVMLIIISYLFGNIAKIGTPNIFYYGLFVFLNVYSFTELMDKNPYAIVWELLKNAFGIGLVIRNGDWFGLRAVSPMANDAVIGYFVLSTAVTTFFVYSFTRERKMIP